MNCWASGTFVVTGKTILGIPCIKYAFCRGPSLKTSAWKEWPGSGTVGAAGVAGVVVGAGVVAAGVGAAGFVSWANAVNAENSPRERQHRRAQQSRSMGGVPAEE